MNISLYVDKKSFVHDIDPITKIFYILFTFLLPVFYPSMAAYFFCILLSFILLLFAGVLKNTLPVLGLLSFILITIVIIQGLFAPSNRTPVFTLLGLTFYQEGLFLSAKVVLRTLSIISSIFILVFTTPPDYLVEVLVQNGLSPRFGYVIISIFQIIPQMMAASAAITDAQRARGLETEGSMIIRIKAFVPLLGPLVLHSLINTKERAMALEVRAFHSKNTKTFLYQREDYPYRIVLRTALLFLLALALVGRIIGL